MVRIAVATSVLLACFGAQAADEPYDPITTPAPQAVRATQAALVGLDQRGEQLLASGVFGTVIEKEGSTPWQQLNIPTSVLLTSIDIVDEEHIWAAGHDGVIVQSTDGGNSWQRRLDGYQLLNLEHPWLQTRMDALEARIDATEDAYEAEELEFELEELGFLMSGLEIQFEVGPTKPFLDIHFLNRSTGFAIAAYGTLLKTTDGGDSWQVLNDKVENPYGYHLNKIVSDKENRLYILGEYGLMSRSSDLGESWTTLETPYDGSFFGGVVDQTGHLWVFGLRGNIFSSSDHGESFQGHFANTNYNLNSGTVLDDGRIVLVGHSGVIVVIEPETDTLTTYTHESSVSIMGVRQLQGNELLLVGRAGLQRFTIPTDATGMKG